MYALGVILYELLSGRLPFDVSRKSLPEAERITRDEEPARLSSITRALPADVDTIVAKALEKDKLRRYGSAAELAEDIRHFLRDEPIVARRPSASYQVRKFARRGPSASPKRRLHASIERLVKFYAGAGRREDAAAWQKQLLLSR